MMRSLAILVAVAGLGLTAQPSLAQGKAKHYAVSSDRAIVITKDVLIKHGYEVVRIEQTPTERIVYYRRGNMGKGKGKGRLEKLVIRRVENRIVFVDTPDIFLVDIDVKLRLP